METGKEKLARYFAKRDMDKTPEPADLPTSDQEQDPLFVMQKHAATNLHYDFRLAADGVLKSWAVPKGPSTDPSTKRLAIATEDHPMAYANFEGVIPAGHYGAGTVLVWDQGSYENTTEENGERITVAQGIEKGQLTFRLHGQKLRGGYALIRTGQGKGKQWLLVKMKDGEADAERNPVETEPRSVLSGRTLEEIADQGDAETESSLK